MAARDSRKKPMKFGSKIWISDERGSAALFIQQEVEEFGYSVRNEMDWLNEHVGDIFSKTHKSITDVFKTPGKLRGKTPRTARKRNPLEARAPLTDIFSSNAQNISKARDNAQSTGQSLVSQPVDPATTWIKVKPFTGKADRAQKTGKENTDSGYHGATEDEMDYGPRNLAHRTSAILVLTSAPSVATTESQETIPLVLPATSAASNNVRTTGSSFHSAEEAISAEVAHKKPACGLGARISNKSSRAGCVEIDSGPNKKKPAKVGRGVPDPVVAADPLVEDEQSLLDNQLYLEGSRSQLEASSPFEPIQRNSSLSFAFLPAREALGPHVSIGAEISYASNSEHYSLQLAGHDVASDDKITGNHEEGTGSDRLPAGDGNSHKKVDAGPDAHRQHESSHSEFMTELHRKTSTQRLHDRISQLGQTQSARPTKSLQANVQRTAQTAVNATGGLPESTGRHTRFMDNDEDWISSDKPATNATTLLKKRIAGSAEDKRGEKTTSAAGFVPSTQTSEQKTSAEIQYQSLQRGETTGTSPRKSGSTAVVSAVNITAKPQPAIEKIDSSKYKKNFGAPKKSATTKNNGQGNGDADGPLSASKAKLSSLLKSARGIFVSSAGVSAQAKMEALSPTTMRQLQSHINGSSIDAVVEDSRAKQRALSEKTHVDDAGQRIPEPSAVREHKADQGPSRRTRSSTEKEERRKAREEERQRAADQARTSAEREERRKAREAEELQKVADQIRSASEREERRKAREADQSQRVAAQVEKARQEAIEAVAAQKQKATLVAQKAREIEEREHQKQSEAKMAQTSNHRSSRKRKSADGHDDAVTANEPPTKFLAAESSQRAGVEPEFSRTQTQAPVPSTKEARRPTKPGKIGPSRAKPVPVAIKVGTASQRELDNRKGPHVNPSTSSLASNLQQSLAPPAASASRRPELQSKPSASSLRNVASNASLRSAASSQPAKPKALAAAARKKEQDEREAQRKLEHKRELERKRIAQQEEERKREQHRAEQELQRQREQDAAAEDPKKIAQKQAIERRRLENAKKHEQPRNAPMHTRAKAGAELTRSTTQEKIEVVMPPHPRGELSNARTVSKLNAGTNVRSVQEEFNRAIVQPPMNPARPPKRVAPAEDVDERQTGLQSKVTATYTQVESKRRKTNEDQEAMEARQAMPPPMRQSNFRKEAHNKGMYTQAYINAAPGSQAGQIQRGSSLLKVATSSQHHLQHPQQQPKTNHLMDMNKFASAKIPFADTTGNTAGPSTSQKHSNRVPPPNGPVAAGKSSPHYPEGDAISLPEIATDSEDDENEENKGFSVPDWAQSPALRSLLSAQQLVDPEEVFGPMAPLHMEEIFKNKDRHHRFRNRTSSANWNGQDRLTQEEIQKDMEARQQLIENGGWTYGLS